MIFSDRAEAGKKLAQVLTKYQGKDVVVYALPRGGVPVAAEIAKALKAPLDLLIIRKIGHPNNPEYALCAVSLGGHIICDEVELAHVNPSWFQEELEREIDMTRLQNSLYFEGRKPFSVMDKTAIIVDDGIATGLTAKAAIREIKNRYPKEIIVATPVLPKDTAEDLRKEVDALVALEIPEEFAGSVGSYYTNFPQVTDEEVIKLLQKVNLQAIGGSP